MPGRKPNDGLAMVSTLLHYDGADLSLRSFRLYAGSLCSFSAGPIVSQLEVLFSSNFLWAISLFHQIINGLFLCDNILHKLEILYSSLTRLCFKRNQAESRAKIWRHNAFKQPVTVASAVVHSLAVILSLLNAHSFITRLYSLIKFCIRIHVNIVQTLACVTASFGWQGFAEHEYGG